MNKTEFLKELESCLAVLDAKEQQDILEEYTQHIDLKIESGLSEEEAIHDFGNLHQLAAEILEAYHVNPDYTGSSKKSVRANAAAGGKRVKDASLGFFKKTGQCLHRAGAAVCRCWRALLEKIHSYAAGIRIRRNPGISRQPISHGQEMIPVIDRNTRSERSRRQLRTAGAGFRRFIKNTSRGIGAFFGGCISLAVCCLLFCLRWAWNIFLILLALLSGCFALTSLFMFAAVIVWLAQGYPLTGITLLCLGAVLCSGSLTVLCLSLLRPHKKRETALAVNCVRSEEVQNA